MKSTQTAGLSTQVILEALDHRDGGLVGANHIRLCEKFGLDQLAPYYVAAFPNARNWVGRDEILFWVMKLARSRIDVVEVARLALNDRSWKVRYQACAILAYSLTRTAVPDLERLLQYRDERTRRDAAAAMKAILRRNHHLFADRDGAGNVFWIVNPGDSHC